MYATPTRGRSKDLDLRDSEAMGCTTSRHGSSVRSNNRTSAYTQIALYRNKILALYICTWIHVGHTVPVPTNHPIMLSGADYISTMHMYILILRTELCYNITLLCQKKFNIWVHTINDDWFQYQCNVLVITSWKRSFKLSLPWFLDGWDEFLDTGCIMEDQDPAARFTLWHILYTVEGTRCRSRRHFIHGSKLIINFMPRPHSEKA